MPRKPQYPYEQLEVGDAFDVTHTTSVVSIRSLAGYYARKLGRRFEVRWIESEHLIEVSRLPDGAGEAPVVTHVPREVVGTLSKDVAAQIDEVRRKIDAGEL